MRVARLRMSQGCCRTRSCPRGQGYSVCSTRRTGWTDNRIPNSQLRLVQCFWFSLRLSPGPIACFINDKWATLGCARMACMRMSGHSLCPRPECPAKYTSTLWRSLIEATSLPARLLSCSSLPERLCGIAGTNATSWWHRGGSHATSTRGVEPRLFDYIV